MPQSQLRVPYQRKDVGVTLLLDFRESSMPTSRTTFDENIPA